jgi:CheY-like chemotaxis protein/DNA-binding XRE family transcriptional regulator
VPNLDVKKSFGASVRVWRDRLGVSQEELAERAGLHRTYISDVERGARNVSLESIEKLARALEISVSALLSYYREPVADNTQARFLSPDELVDILFVEDNADDVELTMRALQRVNMANRIHVVHDGAAALHFLFCTGEYADRQPGKCPQVILLDLGLPQIDGLEVLRRIKADPRTFSVPVVVLTASNRDKDIITSKKLGAEAYIVKPVDFQNLSEVTSQLSLHWALLKPMPVLNP